ncbi:MAG: DUF4062 domain-containing protein, partial [Acidimicrobiales bacterium]|nr:DUF4062 domain-containing protein [Acidimicrobiales bacterium]
MGWSAYEVLGVPEDASPEAVKAAFLAAARIHHPNNATSGDAEMMAAISEAREVLSDPERRRLHDVHLASQRSAGDASVEPDSGQRQPKPEKAHRTDSGEGLAGGAAPHGGTAAPAWSRVSSSVDDRTIRVFVSSTFRDMAAERDVLVGQVFPKLRQVCAERAVTFTEIDLRWGLTDEQVAEGEVLSICLEEIWRCRPYFIGVLGERYGWVPREITPEVLEHHEWLLSHRGTTSVTELEILYGVLNNPEMENHAFFYLRDPAYLSSDRFLADTADRVTDRVLFAEAATAAEIEAVGAEQATAAAATRRRKLTELKE